jgi:histidine triad (HIT) family protein
MNHDCIFCKIVAGQIPAAKVYEDDAAICIMDIGPIIKGHTLVIPKTHVDPLTAAPDALLGRLILLVKKIARAQQAAFHADGVNVVQNNGRVAGQAVPHLHFHVIPRFEGDGHRWNWAAKSYEDPAEMQKLADAMRRALAAG